MDSSNQSDNINLEKKQINVLENIKSDFFLRIIFDNLARNKKLGIIKINKKLQQRMNITINDFKEYLEKYSPIEIEIIPAINKYGKFFNCENEDEDYYHAYACTIDDDDDDYIEIYHSLDKEHTIKKIKLIIDYQVKSLEDLFRECECIESVNFKKFYRNNIINMSRMFYKCFSLKEVIFTSCNTSRVKDMKSMFSYCTSITKLDLSKFNTDWVKDMSYMFHECSSLKELNIYNFNTKYVITMNAMFSGCISLKEINIPDFNNKRAKRVRCMFYGCSCSGIMREKHKNLKEESFIDNYS